jgi:TorA maturation chaperone TorD
MEITEEMNAVLESRAYNYLLFQNVFGDKPTKELIKTISGDVTRQTFEMFALDDEFSYGAILLTVTGLLDALQTSLDESVGELVSEYNKLYIGSDELKAPPWESVYRSTQRLLFQESTLDVRNAYRIQGFLPAEYPHVADDHLALEFAFMAQLGDRAKVAYGEGDFDVVRTALEASRQFLKDHLLIWVPDYVGELKVIEGAVFYPELAELALEFLKIDHGVLGELLAEL